MITDRMRINHADGESLPDYGSLYLVKFNKLTRVNDYGGSNTDDVSKLDLITNASAGSTCLFANGDIYRRELDGWAKFGEDEAELNASQASTANVSPTVTPLNLGRNALTKSVDLGGDQTVETLDYEPDLPEETAADEGKESALEAQKNAATGGTDEVNV